jgi:2-octaprenyl-6-methoxyphenol hydroxylase
VKQVDILIAGGGLVGLPLGIALAKGGLRVAVADAAPQARRLDPRFDGRVSALAYASVRMLAALGVWEHLAPHAQPIHEILVTDGAIGRAPSPFSLHFDAQEVGTNALGHIAENRHIRLALQEAAAATPGLELIAPSAVKSVTVEDGRASAILADGPAIAAPLVIAADGRDSPLREQMGIGKVGWSYPQTGIVATVEHERPHNGVAYEHFLPAGPFAILPLPGNRSSLVWTETKARAPGLLALGEAGFNTELARRFGAHLSAFLPHRARFRGAAFRTGGRRRARHSSHRRAGAESGDQGCRRAGRGTAGRGAAGPRYRRAGRAQALRALAAF